jgi:hypothetical protein
LARAIYSNETFEADDERLNYESYKELSLIGGGCRESSFLKKGEVTSPHFSHFRDIGKNYHWRKGIDSSTQDTDSEKKKQSLRKFQTKFKGIIERGIIQYQQISYSQIRNQIANGISCCPSNLTVNFSTIIVGRAGEPLSVFNLDAPQLSNRQGGYGVN